MTGQWKDLGRDLVLPLAEQAGWPAIDDGPEGFVVVGAGKSAWLAFADKASPMLLMMAHSALFKYWNAHREGWTLE